MLTILCICNQWILSFLVYIKSHHLNFHNQTLTYIQTCIRSTTKTERSRIIKRICLAKIKNIHLWLSSFSRFQLNTGECIETKNHSLLWLITENEPCFSIFKLLVCVHRSENIIFYMYGLPRNNETCLKTSGI